MIGELRTYMIGWRGYFGFCETPSILRDLDRWTRRRLRCFLWKQWKRGTVPLQGTEEAGGSAKTSPRKRQEARTARGD